MQEPNPLPWGAQDRYQAHFIVRKNVQNTLDYVARTILSTKGHFGSKKVIGVNWSGGKAVCIISENTSKEIQETISSKFHSHVSNLKNPEEIQGWFDWCQNIN